MWGRTGETQGWLAALVDPSGTRCALVAGREDKAPAALDDETALRWLDDGVLKER